MRPCRSSNATVTAKGNRRPGLLSAPSSTSGSMVSKILSSPRSGTRSALRTHEHRAQNFRSLKLTRSVFCIHAAGHREPSRKLTAFVPRQRVRSLQQSSLSGPSFPPVGGALRRCVLLEERVSERTRIARELHDTLLQSFQGVLLKLSAVKYLIRDRPKEAEEQLDRMVEQAEDAITEGRDAVLGLRSSTVIANDLDQAITKFGVGLATYGGSREFCVRAEGTSIDLFPSV